MNVRFWCKDEDKRKFFFSNDTPPHDHSLPGVREWCDYFDKHKKGSDSTVLIYDRVKACAYYDYLLELGHEVTGDVDTLFT